MLKIKHLSICALILCFGSKSIASLPQFPWVKIEGLWQFGAEISNAKGPIISEEYNTLFDNLGCFTINNEYYNIIPKIEYCAVHLDDKRPVFNIVSAKMFFQRNHEQDAKKTITRIISEFKEKYNISFKKESDNYYRSNSYNINYYNYTVPTIEVFPIYEKIRDFEIDAVLKRQNINVKLGRFIAFKDTPDSLFKKLKTVKGCKLTKTKSDVGNVVVRSKGPCFGVPNEFAGLFSYTQEDQIVSHVVVDLKDNGKTYNSVISALKAKYKEFNIDSYSFNFYPIKKSSMRRGLSIEREYGTNNTGLAIRVHQEKEEKTVSISIDSSEMEYKRHPITDTSVTNNKKQPKPNIYQNIF